MTNEELAEATRKAAADLSFYNAAEGENRRSERTARSNAYQRFQELRKQCEKYKINWNPDNIGYLV
jgi:hypothetical protein